VNEFYIAGHNEHHQIASTEPIRLRHRARKQRLELGRPTAEDVESKDLQSVHDTAVSRQGAHVGSAINRNIGHPGWPRLFGRQTLQRSEYVPCRCRRWRTSFTQIVVKERPRITRLSESLANLFGRHP
jgi:hypothetical protein